MHENGSRFPPALKLWQLWLLGSGWWGASVAGEALSAAIRHEPVDLRWPGLVIGYLSTAVALVLLASLMGGIMRRRDTLPQMLAIVAVAAFRRTWESLLLWGLRW